MRRLLLLFWLTGFPTIGSAQWIVVDLDYMADFAENQEIVFDGYSAEIFVPDQLLFQFRSGSEFRIMLGALAANRKDILGTRVPILPLLCLGINDEFCQKESPLWDNMPLADPTPFFEYHLRAMIELRQRFNDSPSAPLSIFRPNIADVIELGEIYNRLSEIFFVLAWRREDVPDPALIEEWNSLMSRRLFTDLITPPPEMTLTSINNWSRELGAISLPFDRPERPEHIEARTVTFIAENIGDNSPSEISFDISSNAEFTFLTPDFSENCIGDYSQTTCSVAFDGDPVEFSVAIWHPDFRPNEYDFTTTISVTLSARTPEIESAEMAKTEQQTNFSYCNKQFKDRLDQSLNAEFSMQNIVRLLREESRPILGLPGKLLFSPMTFPEGASGFEMPSEANGYSSQQEINVWLNDIVSNQATDSFMRFQLLPLAEASLTRLSEAQQCQPNRFTSELLLLDEAQQRISERISDYQKMTDQSRYSLDFWQYYSQRLLDEFEEGRFFPIPKASAAQQTAELGGSTVAGGMLNTAVGLGLGAAAMESFAAKANIVGAIAATLQALSALNDLYDLAQIEEYIDESIAWLEAQAYFEGVLARYQKIDTALANGLSNFRNIESYSCICYNP